MTLRSGFEISIQPRVKVATQTARKDILDYRDYEYVDDRWNNDWDDDAPSDDAVATH